MRNIFTALVAAAFVTLGFYRAEAQMPGQCGTQVTETQKQWLMDYVQAGRNIGYKKGAMFYVPISFHIVGDNDGKGYYNANQLLNELCELNRNYAPVGFYFYLNTDIEYINNYSYYDHPDYSAGYSMMFQYNVDSAVNVYVVANPAGNCGYFSPYADGIAVGKNCMGPGATTMTHEIGHFFSLPHPFDNVLGIKEYVNGSNCDVGGDLFCDTKADFINIRWNCPYNGIQKDPLGDTYHPDQTLYMSYSMDLCQNKFSGEQMDAMNYNILTQRDVLQGPVQDTNVFTSRVNRVWPQENVATKPLTTFKWNSVPGAKWYVLQATVISFFPVVMPVDVIMNDTTYTTTLMDNRTYRWRVRPLKPGRTCSEFSDTGIFFTSVTAGISNVSASSAVKIYPNPVNEGSEVYIAFEKEETANLEAEIFTVEGKTIATRPMVQQSGLLYTVNTGGLTPGFYWINIHTGTTTYRQKLVIQ